MSISIAATDRVFVLTGAGISAESGLPTFRASDGLWAGHRVEDVCTPEALKRDPWLVWDFYSKRRADNANAQPNPAHVALAELEAQLPGRFFLCTQNVDDLHERAGSRNLIHMHGELAKARCERECGRPPVEDRAIYASLDEVGRCSCGGRLRPHIVFFGEIPLEMPRIEREIAECHADDRHRHFRQRLSRGQVSSIGPDRAAREPSTSAPSRRSTPRPSRTSLKAKAGEVLPGLFEVQS